MGTHGMSTDIQREESFRTALRNQKRRLSATEKKTVTEATRKSLLGNLKTRDSLTPPRRDLLTPPRTSSTPSRKSQNRMGDCVASDQDVSNENSCPNSKQSTPDIRLEFWDINELSPLSTPAVSRSPSPFDLHDLQLSRSPSPRNIRSPLPPNSPLLSPHRASPQLKKVQSFNKELRRARSFRNAREKSASRNSSAANSRCSSPCPETILLKNKPYQQEVSFSIKKSFGSRKGWKIMPDDGHHDIDASALQSVVSIIKDMEVKGFAVPERISIKIP